MYNLSTLEFATNPRHKVINPRRKFVILCNKALTLYKTYIFSLRGATNLDLANTTKRELNV